jgi:acyl-CoA synthetase (AMP-forming)/AMP-acid ligase II
MLKPIYPYRDLIHLLEFRAQESAHKSMYSFLDRRLECSLTYCYGDFFVKTKQMAARLQSAGLSRTPVLLLQLDAKDFVLTFWACILAGAWPMPCVRPRGARWDQLGAMLVQSGVSAVITTAAVEQFIPAELMAGIDVFNIDNLRQKGSHESQWIRPALGADDIAFIQYTSGSTSNPRGVVITHGNILSNLQLIHQEFDCSEEDIGLNWLPLHHDMGLVGHVLQPCFSGIHNYFMRAADFAGDPQGWLQAIDRYRATISGGPCFAYALCSVQGQEIAELDLSCWRLAYCGSQKVIPEVLNKFARCYEQAGFSERAWFPCYGLAESTLFVGGMQGVHTTRVSDQIEPLAAVARVNANSSDIKIVDPVTGLLCADGKKGEIWICSPSVSPGYFRHTEQSRCQFDQFIHGHGSYFRTGDLGFIRDGVLYFSGRTKNLLKLRGRSVHGEDIESLVEHEVSDLGVRQCVVVAHSVDYDETFSLLVEWAGRARSRRISQIDIESKIRNLVCDTFSVLPHRVVFLVRGSLPLTTSGKPARAACQAVLLHHLANSPQCPAVKAVPQEHNRQAEVVLNG